MKTLNIIKTGTTFPDTRKRLGECAWGVQFHPEYHAGIMRSYIQEQENDLASAGRDVSQILDSVSEAPVAAQVLRNFARFVNERMAYH